MPPHLRALVYAPRCYWLSLSPFESQRLARGLLLSKAGSDRLLLRCINVMDITKSCWSEICLHVKEAQCGILLANVLAALEQKGVGDARMMALNAATGEGQTRVGTYLVWC